MGPRCGRGIHSVGSEAEDVADCGFFNNRVTFTSDGSLMAVTSHDFTVALIDATNGALVHQFGPLTSTTHDIAFSPDDALLVAASDLGAVTVWNVPERSVEASFETPLGGGRAIETMPGGASVATVDGSGTLRLVVVRTGRIVLTFDESSTPTTSIALSTDGALSVSDSRRSPGTPGRRPTSASPGTEPGS